MANGQNGKHENVRNGLALSNRLGGGDSQTNTPPARMWYEPKEHYILIVPVTSFFKRGRFGKVVHPVVYVYVGTDWTR